MNILKAPTEFALRLTAAAGLGTIAFLAIHNDSTPVFAAVDKQDQPPKNTTDSGEALKGMCKSIYIDNPQRCESDNKRTMEVTPQPQVQLEQNSLCELKNQIHFDQPSTCDF